MNEEVMEDVVETIEQASAPEPAPAEKLLTQEQVNAIVGREKASAADRVRREMQAAQQQQQQLGGMPAGMSMDEIYAQVESRMREASQKKSYEDKIRQVADTYLDKMSTGSELFEDFAEVMEDFDPARFPSVIYLATEMENLPQIMYELANNPMKLASINSLAQTDERQAKKALKKLSESISQNDKARDEYSPTNSPISKLKPSSVSADKNMSTLQDFKSASWLRR